jgi:hypothetical protein
MAYGPNHNEFKQSEILIETLITLTKLSNWLSVPNLLGLFPAH